MSIKSIENKIRTVAAFAEAGADLESDGDRKHADTLFEGARIILNNSEAMASACVPPNPLSITFTPAELVALEAMAESSTGDEQDMEAVLGSSRSRWGALYRALNKLGAAIEKSGNAKRRSFSMR